MRSTLALTLCIAALIPSQLMAQGYPGSAYQPTAVDPSQSFSPTTANLLIDDWLGYGYLRSYQGNNPYGGYTHSMYSPAYPALFSHRCPLWLPFAPCFSLLGALATPFAPPYGCLSPYGNGYGSGFARGYAPGYGYGPGYPAPPGAGAWNSMPGAYPGAAPWACPPQCPPDPCQPVCPPIVCQPVCPPRPVQVPVTTCRPMTVDAGYYQTVWVSRPQTVMVPETRWETRWIPQGPTAAPQMLTPGCSDPSCVPEAGMTPGTPATSMNTGTSYPGGTPMMSRTMTRPIPQAAAPWQPASPGFNTRPFVAGGELYGDHELPAAAWHSNSAVTPNAWYGAAPPVVPASVVRRYPVAVQPQRRYISAVR